MTESDFWGQLEFRVCRELEGVEELHRRGLWCDGFIPEAYDFEAPTPSVSGRVWMGTGSRKQEQWVFTLLLPSGATDREHLDWAALLPPEDVTKWLGLDIEAKQLEINPGASVSD